MTGGAHGLAAALLPVSVACGLRRPLRTSAGAAGQLEPPLSSATSLAQGEFNSGVQYGFQATATWHQGSIIDREEGATGKLHSTVGSCKWAFSVEPVCGWGEQGGRQRATAGWLAALPVFEPHWQVGAGCKLP